MEITNLDYYNGRFIDIITEKYNEMLYKLFSEGLKLKGFSFNDRYEMIEFIKSNCSCQEYKVHNSHIYLVNGIEFLLIKHEKEMKINNLLNSNFYHGFDMNVKYKFL